MRTCKRWWKGRNLVVKSQREVRSSCGCTRCLSLYPAATPCSMFKFELILYCSCLSIVLFSSIPVVQR